MYCGASVANDAIWQQFKKERGSGCITAGGSPDSKFWSWCSRHVEVLKMKKFCGYCQWEFTVISNLRSAQVINIVKLQAALKCSHSTFSWSKHNLIHRENGHHDLPLFSPLFLCGYWQPVCLLFALTGCHVASCGTSPSHPPACLPLHLCLLLHLVLVCPG